MNVNPLFFLAFMADAMVIPTEDIDRMAVETLDALRQPESSEMMLVVDHGDIMEFQTVAQVAERDPMWWTDPKYHAAIADAMIGGLAGKLVEQRHGREVAGSLDRDEMEMLFTLLTPHRHSMMAALKRRYCN